MFDKYRERRRDALMNINNMHQYLRELSDDFYNMDNYCKSSYVVVMTEIIQNYLIRSNHLVLKAYRTLSVKKIENIAGAIQYMINMLKLYIEHAAVESYTNSYKDLGSNQSIDNASDNI